MALLKRSEWYDLQRTTNWTPTYVTEDELFPPEMSDPYGIPAGEWERFDEPYKVTYREYVKVQREKDAGAYSVKAALEHSDYYDKADPAYLSMLKMHYGAISLSEYAACQPGARTARFGKAPGLRNMGLYAFMDEMRHGQIQLWFPHALVSRDRQFDWAVKAPLSENWSAIAGRHMMDDVMMTRDAATCAIMLSFAFEEGLTNVQLVGLSEDSAKIGDHTFANLITSIQSDEARHAQIGTPVIEIMLRNGKKAEAQYALDVAFWRVWRTFAVLVGVPMDYQFPLEKRAHSFKEYMHEFVITQFQRQIYDVGLERPWYWDHFLEDIENHHHCQHAGIWSWRQTVWWNPTAGVGRSERAWLEKKYPGWNDSYGKYWDVIIENLLNGREELTWGDSMTAVCDICQIPISNRPGREWKARAYQHMYERKLRTFCSPVCKWIFESDPIRYKDHQSIVHRMYNGQIPNATFDNVLRYMGIGVISHGGRDAHDYAWVNDYRRDAVAAA